MARLGQSLAESGGLVVQICPRCSEANQRLTTWKMGPKCQPAYLEVQWGRLLASPQTSVRSGRAWRRGVSIALMGGYPVG